jgi:transposase
VSVAALLRDRTVHDALLEQHSNARRVLREVDASIEARQKRLAEQGRWYARLRWCARRVVPPGTPDLVRRTVEQQAREAERTAAEVADRMAKERLSLRSDHARRHRTVATLREIDRLRLAPERRQ